MNVVVPSVLIGTVCSMLFFVEAPSQDRIDLKRNLMTLAQYLNCSELRFCPSALICQCALLRL